MTDLLRCPEISYLPEQAIGTCRLNGKPCFKETHLGAFCAFYEAWLKECQVEFDREHQAKEALKQEKSRRGKRAKWRGSNEERACAKITHGVVVGRSKAVEVKGKWYRTDCQKPPDVISPPYSFEVKNRPFPKTVSDAVSQAIGNCPEGLTPKVWWRDRDSGVRYIIEILPDFLSDHI